MAEAGEPLSERELAVLESLVDGSTNREIANKLKISHNTVKVHLRNIFTKLEVTSRTEAVTVAMQQGILSGPAERDESPKEVPQEIDGVVESESVGDGGAATAIDQPQSSAVRIWPVISVVLVAVIAILLVILISSSLNGQEEAPVNGGGVSAEEQIQPERIGDTNWLKAESLLGPRANMAAATIGLDLYHIGGEVEAGIVSLVEVFDTSTQLWRTAASKPTAVANATAAVLFGEIYVPGGRLADGNPTSVVEVYSPANDAWRQITPLPKPTSGAIVLSDGDLLYIFGGWDGSEYLAENYVYDPGTDEWQELAPMEAARANAAGAALENQLFVVGGTNETGELKECTTYSIAEDSWASCAPMEAPRAGAGAAVLGNKLIYVLGGGSDAAVVNGEVYDVNQDRWQPVDMPMLDENFSWYDLGVSNVETRIYVFGGRQNGELVDVNYIYSPLIHQTFLPAVGDR